MIRTIKDTSVKINCTSLISKNNHQNRQTPAALTKWWFNGEVLSTDNEPGSDSLFLEHTTLANEGNYTCEQFGDARASVYLKVQGM